MRPAGAGVVVAPRKVVQAGYCAPNTAGHQIWVRYNGHLVSKHNGFALDIDDDSTSRGTPVVVNPGVVSAGVTDSRTADQWDIDASGVITERRTGLVLDVAGNRTEADSPVIVWTRKRAAWGANQRWELVPLTTQECYPPRPTITSSKRPRTHSAVNDAAFLRGSGDPNWTFVTEHTWHPDTYMLETVLQYGFENRINDIRFVRLVHFPTVRHPYALQRNFPPATNDTIGDVWAGTMPLAAVVNGAPEELYAVGLTERFPTHERPAFAGRIEPIMQSTGDSTNR